MDIRFLYYGLSICQFGLSYSSASRILGLFPVESKSHYTMHRAVMKGLASKGGHQVTVISFFNDTAHHPNYTSIELGRSVHTFVDSISPEEGKNSFTGIRIYIEMLLSLSDSIERRMCDGVYSHEYVRSILQNKIQPPDLLIVESFYLPCYNSLAEKFDIPLIVSLVPTYVHAIDYFIGNSEHPAYWPSSTTDYTQTMNFGQRLINWLHYSIMYAVYHLWTIQELLNIDKIYVNNEHITTDKLIRRTNLVFDNNHFSFLNRPTVPNSIQIGGIHIEDVKSLPPDIEEFIEGAKDGAIFMSFGTTIKMSSLPKEKIEVFVKAFSQIPQRVLWRSDLVNITDAPTNVMIKNWFPQRDILEHENVKAFISHCGISSVHEAIYTAKPVIGIPFLYDQYTNINILLEKGVAIKLEYDNLNVDNLLESLKEIVNDLRYRENVKTLSAVFKDRPMSPLDTVLYWVEYVIKYKGAAHLRIPSADMPLYKFLLLDIISFILITSLFTIWLTRYVIQMLIYYRPKSILTNKKNN